MTGTEEAREAVFADALDAMNWRALRREEMVAFIVGAVGQAEHRGVREGIRLAREAVLANPTWHRGMYGAPDDMYARIAIARAIDALEADHD